MLDRAIAAQGGESLLSDLDQVRVRLSGPYSTAYAGENPSPNGSPPHITRHLDITIQKKADRYSYGSRFDNADINSTLNGSNSNFTFIYTPDSRFLYFPKIRKSTSGFAPASIAGSARFYVPHLIVAELAANRDQLTWVGEGTLDGHPVDRIHYATGLSGYRIFLFRSDTGHLVGLERPAVDARRGDIVQRVRITGYHTVAGQDVPGRFTAGSDKETFYDYQYDEYDLSAAISDSVYSPPPGYEIIRNTPFPGRRLRSLTGNVHIYGPTQTMIVEFESEVVVVGLPFDVLEKIREVVGEKPIRVGIPTHHHDQHVAGMRAFVKAGIPIMTTARNRAYFDQLARARFDLDPDAQSLDPREPVFQIVDDRHVFDDGTTRLEIINIGPVGHADDMYVAYLPKEGIVFTADLFEFNPEAIPPTVGAYYHDLAVANLRALKSAVPNATTLVRAHRYTMPMAELEALIDSGSH
ncbi:MAG: MBL fold metallo-hydrolase [Gemmatimonadota bacterium]